MFFDSERYMSRNPAVNVFARGRQLIDTRRLPVISLESRRRIGEIYHIYKDKELPDVIDFDATFILHTNITKNVNIGYGCANVCFESSKLLGSMFVGITFSIDLSIDYNLLIVLHKIGFYACTLNMIHAAGLGILSMNTDAIVGGSALNIIGFLCSIFGSILEDADVNASYFDIYFGGITMSSTVSAPRLFYASGDNQYLNIRDCSFYNCQLQLDTTATFFQCSVIGTNFSLLGANPPLKTPTLTQKDAYVTFFNCIPVPDSTSQIYANNDAYSSTTWPDLITFTVSDIERFSYSAGRFTYNGIQSRSHLVNIRFSISYSNPAGVDWVFYVEKNGVAIGESEVYFTTSGGAVVNESTFFVDNSTTNDYGEFYFDYDGTAPPGGTLSGSILFSMTRI